jgi:L-rhamnose isomerase
MTRRDDKQAVEFSLASEQFSRWGVDVESALQRLGKLSVSLHCWQGDDVVGFESSGSELGGGLAVTGNYPGRARTADELRSDVQQALALIPGTHRFNLHASYAETGGQNVARDELAPEHFQGWVEWARQQHLKLDFNPTFFAHPMATEGTLSHADPHVRQFWIDHGKVCRRIAAWMGRATGSACVNNVWIPDGSKDTPVDRLSPRMRLLQSLDEVFAESLPSHEILDAVECKLFGLGSESYVVGSHEFYLGYAITHQKVLCLDAGHFHPTEEIADKLSSTLLYVPRILLHVSRGVRWDSDHVVILSDELRAIAHELVRGEFLDRVHLGLDFFDASINRVAAWVIGTRALLKALLMALLEPLELLREAEQGGDRTARLAWLEEAKFLPYGAVWDEYCCRADVPRGKPWLQVMRDYEQQVLSKRSIAATGSPG